MNYSRVLKSYIISKEVYLVSSILPKHKRGQRIAIKCPNPCNFNYPLIR